MNFKDIQINWCGHSGFLIKYGSNIYIDPFRLGEDPEKADMILITHSHYDHCSVEDLKKIIKPGTKVIGPPDILSQTRQVGDLDFEIAELGKTLEFGDVKIECVPAYNTNKSFHSKEEYWVGYVLDVGGVRIYHAGDSDLIPEMKQVKADVALLPMSGKFTMNVDEAVRAAEAIKPELVIPMHYGTLIGTGQDAQSFVSKCREKGINAVILEKE